MKKAELLSPAKDLATGIIAINNGADAVYIGAPAFGARKAAANSIEDIRQLTEYAHRFYCKVFVTLNTLLYDEELAEAEKLIRKLYEIGVDALIVQDMGILRMDIPPISLHASTQMHNYDLERIKFLDRIGFQRIVLAREVSLEQIREIRKAVKAELEYFIHGALCVSLSGQCYLSQHMFGRSANRGECAQPCRMKWSVRDSAGRVLVRDRYVLSLKDLNLSLHMEELAKAGIDSFKIEGRLKDQGYVANVTNHYYTLLNEIRGVVHSGSGVVSADFKADPERSFNRLHTNYFLHGRQEGLVNMDSPKSMGKEIGVVKRFSGNSLWVNLKEEIHNGDGLCYFEKGELKGIRINTADGECLVCNEKVAIPPGTILYRNYDRQFDALLSRESVRKIRITIQLRVDETGIELSATDENGNTVYKLIEEKFDKAENPQQEERIKGQLMKCGDSEFVCEEATYEGEVLFIPSARLNAMRRELLEDLRQERERNREVIRGNAMNDTEHYPLAVDWRCNVVNRKAEEFYRMHGISDVEWGLEKNDGISDKVLMDTKYCLLHELGRCMKKSGNADLQFPLFLFNDKYCFRLNFDCRECRMKVETF